MRDQKLTHIHTHDWHCSPALQKSCNAMPQGRASILFKHTAPSMDKNSCAGGTTNKCLVHYFQDHGVCMLLSPQPAACQRVPSAEVPAGCQTPHSGAPAAHKHTTGSAHTSAVPQALMLAGCWVVSAEVLAAYAGCQGSWQGSLPGCRDS